MHNNAQPDSATLCGGSPALDRCLTLPLRKCIPAPAGRVRMATMCACWRTARPAAGERTGYALCRLSAQPPLDGSKLPTLGSKICSAAAAGQPCAARHPVRYSLPRCPGFFCSKTHTMMGPQEDPGLSVRALQALFDITAAEAEGGHHRTISVRWAGAGVWAVCARISLRRAAALRVTLLTTRQQSLQHSHSPHSAGFQLAHAACWKCTTRRCATCWLPAQRPLSWM